jgi:uncharacterized membrane protein
MRAMKYITAFVLLLVLDIGWIGINLGRYQDMVEKIQHTPMELNFVGAMISYSIIYLALILFAIPHSEKAIDEETTKFWISFRHGGLLGFCIYGIYDFTNLSIFTNYNVLMAVLDTCWGTTLFTLTTYGTIRFFPTEKKSDTDFIKH